MSLLRSAGAMGAATFLSRVMGLVREQVFAFLFGAGAATDAFNVAFRIPNLLRDLFAEGAMSAALVPVFTKVRKEEGDLRAWRVAGLVFRVLTAGVGLLAIAGIVFAPTLVGLYAGAFHEAPGKFELTVFLTRAMFPFFPLVALAAAFMGILNACGKFFWPAFASALFNLASVITGLGFVMLFRHWGQVDPILGMAIGVVIGGAVQAFCQLPVLRQVGYQWPQVEGVPFWKDPALRRMLLLMVPGLVGLAATQVNVLVNTVLATSQGTGAVSYLNYAFRLMQFPIGIFGVSLASATLPQVSRLWVDRDFQGTAETLGESLSRVFAVNLPAAAGLAFLSVPIIGVLFRYGRFNVADVEATARVLVAYSIGLPAYSGVKVLVPACYAMGKTRIAVVSSMLSVGATIFLNLLLVERWSYVGLALGTSFAACLNFVFLVFSVRAALLPMGVSFPWRRVGRALGLSILVSAGMGGFCWGLFLEGIGGSEPFFAASAGVRLLWVGALVGSGGVLAIALAKVLGLKELSEFADLIFVKLKKKLSPPRN